jgi:hypothetical protein
VGSADFRINAQVRQILVRHWIETDALTANAVNGTLYIRGNLQFRPAKRGQVGEITVAFLEKLEHELKMLRELKKIRWQLENWEKDETGWLPHGERGLKGGRKADEKKNVEANQPKNEF